MAWKCHVYITINRSPHFFLHLFIHFMSTIFITVVHKCRCCVHLLEHFPPLISQSVNSDSIYIKHVGHVTINFTNCFLNDKISESQMSWQICVRAHKSVIFVMIASAEVYIQDIYSTKCNFFLHSWIISEKL